MAANENVGAVRVDHCQNAVVIMSWPASDMGHENLFVLAVKQLDLRTFEADFLGIAITVDTHKRLERGYGMDEVNSSPEVAGVPDFIDRVEEFFKFIAEHSVSVGYDAYEHELHILKIDGGGGDKGGRFGAETGRAQMDRYEASGNGRSGLFPGKIPLGSDKYDHVLAAVSL